MTEPHLYKRAAARNTAHGKPTAEEPGTQPARGGGRSRSGVILILLLAAAVVLVGGVAAYLHIFGPGLLGNRIDAAPRTLYSLHGEVLDAIAFVETNDAELTAEFTQTPDYGALGPQTVQLTVHRGTNRLKMEAELYALEGSFDATVEAGTPPAEVTPALFLSSESLAYCDGMLTDPAALSLTGGSSHEIQLLLGGRSLSFTLYVVDTVAPTATPLQEVELWSCDEVSSMDFLTDVEDASPVTAEFAEIPDFSAGGPLTFDILLTDSSGNQSVYTATATVYVDTENPEITGLASKTALLNEKISYRSGVEVLDNHPDGAELAIDSSAVNVAAPGTYPVVYTATDKSGNSVSETIHITILDIDEDTVYAMADDIIAKIIRDDMGQWEKAKAIHTYVHDNIRYVNTGDKSGILQGAYAGMKEKKGDCYTYYALAEVLLNRVGIENQPIQRVGGKTRHFWSLVNLGNGWYHFDSCPTPSAFNSFMFTESQARLYTQEMISYGRPNYYVYDESLYPEVVDH